MDEDLQELIKHLPDEDRNALMDRIKPRFGKLSLDERINLLLPLYVHGGKYLNLLPFEERVFLVYLFSDYSSDEDLINFHRTTTAMEVEGLIFPDTDGPDQIYSPELKAIRIDAAGGWSKHLKTIKDNERLVRRKDRTSIAASAMQMFTGVATLFIISTNLYIANETFERFKRIDQREDTIKILTDTLRQRNQQLKDLSKLIDSLKQDHPAPVAPVATDPRATTNSEERKCR